MNITDIKKFILSEILIEETEIKEDQDLFELGLESLGIIKLVEYIEDNNNLFIDEEELIGENFNTLYSIKKFIESKK